MTQSVVIVESPAKAKTINKYLGSNYTVLSSYGHVRDLPSKNGSVNPDKDFSMLWEVNPKGKSQIKSIQDALKNADNLLLATDPDREGEAISWHIYEILKKKKALVGKDIQRIVFHEITPTAIKEALEHPRFIDEDLVDAYLARRALDYLVGFSLSPILWRKLPGSRSAGRVQSVSLKLIAERENEIELFRSQEYWSLHVLLKPASGKQFEAQLSALDGKKVEKFQWKTKEEAHKLLDRLKGYETYTVSNLEKNQQKRNPSPSFTTSTLQQEASRKLGFPTYKTMNVAQKLYEGIKVDAQTIGLITYMRTDNVNISTSATQAARSMIKENWGDTYIPSSPRFFKSKAKNAQEAHEAIRPTDFSLSPEKAAAYLDADQLKLYTLIWKRSVASQMSCAQFEQVRVKFLSPDQYATLSASGSTLVFDGFLKLYKEGKDEDEEENFTLPPLTNGATLEKVKDRADQHFTQPPPRYTEASLVKKMEELGIGRPSTYSNIIKVLIDRQYVKLEKKRFIPESRGRVVTSFLENYFTQFVQYSFTANLEDKLDDISNGKLNWKDILAQFWKSLCQNVKEAEKLKISDVLDVLTTALEPFLWPKENPEEAIDRLCPKCKTHKLSLKVGKFGAFIGCENYPTCNYTRKLSETEEEKNEASEQEEDSPWPRLLGKADTGAEITIRKGPYGFYVQMEKLEKSKGKPKRAGIPKNYDPLTFSLEEATSLLSLPRELAIDPQTNELIYAGLGRFGPYLKVENTFYSLPKNEDILTIDATKALTILEEKRKEKPEKKKRKAPPKKVKKT